MRRAMEWIGGRWVLLAVATMGILSGMLGCPELDPIRGGGQTGGGNSNVSPVRFGITNLFNDLAFSEEQRLTILYSVPPSESRVTAFYRLLSGPASSGGLPLGVEEIISEDLPAVLNGSFVFDTADLRPGFYQMVISAGGQMYASVGTIELQGPPSPLFLDPAASVTVVAGARIGVVADVGDPQGRAQWRLFFQAADAPQMDEGTLPGGQLLGMRLAEGTGNRVEFTWDTTNVGVGAYRLGLSATDSGFTIPGAVQSGETETIVTRYSENTVTVTSPPSESLPPTLDFTTENRIAFGGEPVEIDFSAQTFEGPDFVVTVYYVFAGIQTTIATITDRTVASVTFDTTDLVTGVYEVGGSISDGQNPVVEVPIAGRVRISVVEAAEAELRVTAPALDMQVAQGASVAVEWSTNVPPREGRSARVYARVMGSTVDIPIVEDLELNITTASWTTANLRGRHNVFVEITAPELAAPLIAQATGVIRVSLTPATIWMGSIGQGATSPRSGERFQGVNFQDDAGTFVNTLGDYNADGRDEYIIGARYGKPYFQNPSGIGVGEAYAILGRDRTNATYNLNQVGTSVVPGVVLPGIRPRDDAQTQTDGLSAVRQVPDQDGDGLPELMFGFPFVNSRGHTYPLVVRREPAAMTTLEKTSQFLRGGIVIVSSQNALISNLSPDDLPPDADAPLGEKAVIYLDLVGQNFSRAEPGETLGGMTNATCGFRPDYFFGVLFLTMTGCMVGNDAPVNCLEQFNGPWTGFNRDLADGFPAVVRPFSEPIVGTGLTCPCAGSSVFLPADPILRSCPIAFGRGGLVDAVQSETPGDTVVGSGFYPLRYCNPVTGLITDNQPQPPFGARVVGRGVGIAGMAETTADRFGASITVSGGFILVSAPQRQPANTEINGLPGGVAPMNPGIVYLFNINNLWADWRDLVGFDEMDQIVGSFESTDFIAQDPVTEAPVAPPMPYQYQIDTIDQCGRNVELLERFPSPFIIVGEAGQRIEIVEAISDFNLDNREDFVVGAPVANNGAGAAYVAYRRDPGIEGDYVLSKLVLAPTDNERLAGVRINGRMGEGFGEVIGRSIPVQDVGGRLFSESVDFNGDGRDDLVLGNPNAGNGTGEVIIVFATDTLAEEEGAAGGLNLDTLLTINDDLGQPRAVRIIGRSPNDRFGFNVSAVTDFNGDGRNDLLVAAPGASPMFDSNDDGTLDTPGIDVINLQNPESIFGDGIADDLDANGQADLLMGAGQVYLIFGTPDLIALAAANTTDSTSAALSRTALNVSTLGSSAFGGLIFVGRAAGHQLGGGLETKRMKRSYGVGPAGDVDGDGQGDVLLSSILADPFGRVDAGEVYLIYGFQP